MLVGLTSISDQNLTTPAQKIAEAKRRKLEQEAARRQAAKNTAPATKPRVVTPSAPSIVGKVNSGSAAKIVASRPPPSPKPASPAGTGDGNTAITNRAPAVTATINASTGVTQPKTYDPVTKAPNPPLPVGSVASAAASPTPSLTPQQIADMAKAQLTSDLATGEAFANKHFYDGAMGRIEDPRKAQMDAFLAKLAARQDGMSPEEMRAAKEQGQSDIDSQLAQESRQLASIAGAHGVRGGAAAGLQRGALNNAVKQRAGLSRQLVLDNLAERSRGTEAYGKALTGQQATELGVQESNLGRKAQEAFGRASTPLQMSGVMDSMRQGILSGNLAQQNADVAKEYVKTFGQTGGYGGGKMSKEDEESVASSQQVATNTTTELDKLVEQARGQGLLGQAGWTTGGFGGAIVQKINTMTAALKEQIDLQNPNKSQSWRDAELKKRVAELYKKYAGAFGVTAIS